ERGDGGRELVGTRARSTRDEGLALEHARREHFERRERVARIAAQDRCVDAQAAKERRAARGPERAPIVLVRRRGHGPHELPIEPRADRLAGLPAPDGRAEQAVARDVPLLAGPRSGQLLRLLSLPRGVDREDRDHARDGDEAGDDLLVARAPALHGAGYVPPAPSPPGRSRTGPQADPTASANARASASAFAKRCAGSLLIACATTAATSPGTRGFSAHRSGGVRVTMSIMSLPGTSPSNGGRPAKHW